MIPLVDISREYANTQSVQASRIGVFAASSVAMEAN